MDLTGQPPPKVGRAWFSPGSSCPVRKPGRPRGAAVARRERRLVFFGEEGREPGEGPSYSWGVSPSRGSLRPFRGRIPNSTSFALRFP